MSDSTAKPNRRAAYVLLLAILLVGAAVVGYDVALPQSTPSASTTVTSGTIPGLLAFGSGVAPDGLQLEMTLNATSMPTKGAIAGQVEVVNTSDQNVTVSTLVRSENVTMWSNYINTCPSDYFMGYAVFTGHFTAENISSAGTPLRLVPPMVLQCPGPSGPSAVTFLPDSNQLTGRVVDPADPQSLMLDQLNMTTGFCNTTQSSKDSFGCAWASPGLVGYWNFSFPSGGNFGLTSPAFSRFSPGEYTAVAWDDWNQYAYATFVVTRA